MRAWSALRQFLAAALCAGFALAASATVPLSRSTPSHAYYREVLFITRARSSSEKILLHFEAVIQLSGEKHWSYGELSWKDMAGSVVTYDYDAFGNLIHSTGTTPNNYLYSGEQFDPDLNLFYNRARYLNVSTGRFWTMDAQEGASEDPLSLHKYLYAENEPVIGTDPSGEATLLETEEVAGESAEEDVQQLQVLQTGRQVINLAKFAAAVTVGLALATEGDNNPTQPLPLPEERKQQEEIIPLYRDADATNPGAFSFTGGSCSFINSEISLLEAPMGNKRFVIEFTASFVPPKTTCATFGAIIDPDLFDLGLGVVYSPTLTPGHWSLITKSYVPTKEEQAVIKGRLAQHAKNQVKQ